MSIDIVREMIGTLPITPRTRSLRTLVPSSEVLIIAKFDRFNQLWMEDLNENAEIDTEDCTKTITANDIAFSNLEDFGGGLNEPTKSILAQT